MSFAITFLNVYCRAAASLKATEKQERYREKNANEIYPFSGRIFYTVRFLIFRPPEIIPFILYIYTLYYNLWAGQEHCEYYKCYIKRFLPFRKISINKWSYIILVIRG